MKPRITALILERLLYSSLILLIVLAALGFSWLNSVLIEHRVAADHAKIDAEIGRSTIDQLRSLESYFQVNQKTVDRAASIVAQSRQYMYQDQIVQDINTYASRAGVTVLGYNFQQQTDKPTAVPAAGLKTISATLTLRAPVPYHNFLRFLKAIERNLTKMQVSGVSLTPDTENRQLISNPSIGLEVYVR